MFHPHRFRFAQRGGAGCSAGCAPGGDLGHRFGGLSDCHVSVIAKPEDLVIDRITEVVITIGPNVEPGRKISR